MDKRIIKTRSLIRNAYLDSVKEIGFRKTTVKEICDRALISRKTFYSHYETIDFLFNELMDEAFSYQKLDLALNIHILQSNKLVENHEAFMEEATALFDKQNHIIRQHADILSVFLADDDPWLEQYFRKRIGYNRLPISKDADVLVALSRDIIAAIKYETVRALVMHPELPTRIFSEYESNTTVSYVNIMYTNSQTFLEAHALPPSTIAWKTSEKNRTT